jgi:cbb3-type cytochrome c oxidase subunit III
VRSGSAALLALAALAVAGCGTGGLATEAADPAHGKQLFKEKCAACHTLREAGTQGSNPVANPSSGPNLDEAFAADRREGFDESTIQQTVRQQIQYAVAPMPRDLVTGDDADAVALYVATVAGNPKAKVAEVGGGGGGGVKGLFTTNCGSCHTLADAGTSGTVGPNLDQLKPTFQAALRQIQNGGGGMPAFKGRLSDKQIQDLARYVESSTHR